MNKKKEEKKKEVYEKLPWSEFLERIKKEMVSHIGLWDVYKHIHTCMDSDPQQIILITGERGTGKELVAKAIHEYGDHSSGDFVPVNCGSLGEVQIDAELFGAKKGAYTGCTEDRVGYFEKADNGVLFLDEIGDLTLEAQKRLMRFLGDRKIEKLGDKKNEPKEAKVKIIAATNRNLFLEPEKLRPDLYDRLKGFTIIVPPLKQRAIDIPVLIRFFMEEQNKRTKKDLKTLDFLLFYFCISYEWPGNVRQLKRFITSCYANCESGRGMDLIDGRGFFSDQTMTRVIGKESIDFPAPMLFFLDVLHHIKRHDKNKLRELIPFKIKKFSNGSVKYFDYPEIKLKDIPGQRKSFIELFKCGDIPTPPSTKEEFIRKIRARQDIKAEVKYLLDYVETPLYKEHGRLREKDHNYITTIRELKDLFEKNEKSLKFMRTLQTPPTKTDLYNLPYKEFREASDKDYFKKALERNSGNKRKTAKAMEISESMLYRLLKKFKL